MKKALSSAIVGIVLAVFLPVSSAKAVQQEITVPDASFEDHVLAEGGYVDIGTAGYTGAWESVSGDAWVDYGYWRADGWPEDLYAHSGNNKAYPYEDYIYQILDETFIEGGTYTLSVWAGQPWVGYASDWRLYLTTEDYTNELIETSGTAGLDWEQISLEYTATAAAHGKKIGIKIWSNEEVSFDDVTLTSLVDPTAPDVDAGDDMITWSGRIVQLDPNVVNNDTAEPQGTLTYLWTAEPDGIGDPNLDVEITSADTENPSVTITKAVLSGNVTVITMTLAVTLEGKDPVIDTMTIRVYDNSCLAAIDLGLALFDPTDIDGDCITNFTDFALMVVTWLGDYSLTEPAAK
ncbi:MAG: hypothetical protein JSU94_19345 [Phycisphaerales bacterium]|nr:MAG: hypothetical protein JSU94_19345 [Phycisphaerales bacterium]